MSFDDARAAKAIQEESLVRSGFSIQLGEHRHQEEDGQDHQSCNHVYTSVHNVSFESSKSSQRRTYAMPLSYRVTITSAPFSITCPSSLFAAALRRTPA